MPKYVMATDEDFKKINRRFHYIGEEPYVEIPHIIQGENITNIDWMFCENGVIKGVKSTNKNIKSMDFAFYKCKTDELDLSEFDTTQISKLEFTFSGAEIKTIIFPNTGFPRIEKAPHTFCNLRTDTLNLSGFDFSNSSCDRIIYGLETKKIIFPARGLAEIFRSDIAGGYYPLEYVPAKSQTEEICWAAVTDNKKQGQFVKIKSKKILMYLGAECPEYTEFYYNGEE